jgi:alpha-tubulin suppressor-like RCC1 family protein
MFSLTVRRLVGAVGALGLVASGLVVGMVSEVATATNNSAAIQAVASTTSPMIAAGDNHSCAVLHTGAVTCWGQNAFGQLGNDTNYGQYVPNSTPSMVGLGGATATAVTAGMNHACALLDTGAVKCWGNNNRGQLGNTTLAATSWDPVLAVLPAGRTATAVNAGRWTTCALLDNDDVLCWGDNGLGQLGNTNSNGSSTAAPVLTPVVLPAGRTATAVSTGGLHTCALLDNGDISCWGYNPYGQLGNVTNNGDHGANPVPVTVVLPAGRTATAVIAAGAHSCALLDSGDVTCWGYDANGQLGNTTTDNSGSRTAVSTMVPVVFPGGRTPTALAANGNHSCAFLDNGALACWGHNNYGQLGNSANNGFGTPNPIPSVVVLPGGSTATGVSAGVNTTCAVLNTGAVACWGVNYYGELGTGTSDTGFLANPDPELVLLPITVPGPPTTVTAVAGDGEVAVSWDASAIDGGSAIDLYTVTSDPDGQSCTTTGALTCTVTGLTNGTSYTFAVTAANTEGLSGLSVASAAVVPLTVGGPVAGIPGSPTGVTAVVGDGEVVVSWDEPFRDGGAAVTGYTVTSTPGAKTCTSTFALPCTVTGLTNGTSYTFTVTAQNIAGLSGLSVASAAVVPLAPVVVPPTVVSVPPTVQSVLPGRVLETRSGNPSFATVDGLFEGAGLTGAGQVVEVKVTGRAGVPVDAAAVFLNVVAVGPSGPGYLTVFPCGITPPLAANVNYITGDVAANAVLAKIGVDGSVCVYTSAATDLVIDVNGYIPAGAATEAVLPGRVFESRSGNPDFKTVDGLFEGAGRTGAGQVAEFKVTGRAGVPDDAAAVFLNVVAVGPSGSGYLTVFPCGTTPPLASNGNYSTGDVAANAVLAKIGVDGNVCVYTSAATDLVVDVNGYTTG